MNANRPLAPISPLLPPWLASEPPGTFAVVLLRVSVNNKNSAIDNANAAKVLAGRPVMQRLAAIGGAEEVFGDLDLREQYGIQQLERRHGSAYADEPRKPVGLLWVDRSSQEILVLAHDSIGADNVTDPSDPLVPRNAMNELVIQLAALPQVSEVHIAKWDRLVRSQDHGSRLATVLLRQSVDVFEGGSFIDLSSDAGRMMVTFRSGMSSSERLAIRTRNSNGMINRTQKGKWVKNPRHVPPGYRTASQRDRTVVADTEHSTEWTQVLQAVANGDTWEAVGALMVRLRLPFRGSAQPDTRLTYADLENPSLTSIAKSAINHESVRLLRTRNYVTEFLVPVPINRKDTKWLDHAVDPVRREDGSAVVPVTVEWPVHHIDLTEAEWRAIDARLNAQPARERTGAENRFPLVPSEHARWEHGAVQRRIEAGANAGRSTEKIGYYRLTQRPIPTRPGQAWKRDASHRVLTVRAQDADRALGTAMEAAALRLAEEGAADSALLLANRHGEAARSEAQLDEVDGQIEEARAELEDAEAAYERHPDQRRTAKLAREQKRLSTLHEYRASIVSMHAEASPSPHSLEIDLSTMAGVAGALQASPGLAVNRDLNTAVRTLLRDTIRLEPSPSDDRFARISAIMHWPSLDGRTLTVPIHADVRRVDAKPVDHSVGESFARLVLDEGHTIRTGHEQLGIDVKDAKSAKASLQSGWLRGQGIGGPTDDTLAHRQRDNARLLCRAALDCPIDVTKQILWAHVTDGPQPNDIDEKWITHVIDTYSGAGTRGKTQWWAGDVHRERRVLEAMRHAAATDEAVDLRQGFRVEDLAEVTGLPKNAIAQLVVGNTSTASGRRVTVLERVNPNRRVSPLKPLDCPTCGEPMLSVLSVPECESVVCAACRRAPGGPELPQEYLRLWDATENPQATMVGSRIAATSDYLNRNISDGKRLQPRLLSQTEVAETLGVSDETIRRWSRNGVLTAYRHTAKRRPSYSPKEVAELKASRASGSADGWVPVEVAAARLHVEVGALRKLARSTPANHAPLPYSIVGGQGTRKMDVPETALTDLDEQWIKDNTTQARRKAGETKGQWQRRKRRQAQGDYHLSVKDVAERTGLPQSFVIAETESCDLKSKSFRAPAGTSRVWYRAEDADAWARKYDKYTLSERDVCDKYGAPLTQVRNATQTGELPHFRFNRLVVRFEEAAAEEWWQATAEWSLTVAQAARRTHQSVVAVYSAINDGILPHRAFGEKLTRLRPSDVDVWAREKVKYPLTAHQAAERSGLSQTRIRNAAKNGHLPHAKVNGLYRFKPSDVDTWTGLMARYPLNSHQIAQRANVTRNTVKTAAQAGALPVRYWTGVQGMRGSLEDCDAWIAAGCPTKRPA